MSVRDPRAIWMLVATLGALALVLVSADVEGADPSGQEGSVDPLAADLPAASAPAPLLADATSAPTALPTPTVPPMPWTSSPEGFQVAVGGGPVVGQGGPLSTYTVEMEPGTGVDLAGLVAVVRDVLEDPTRGWTSRGGLRLQWVDDEAIADVRVVLATPGTVDRFCAQHDLSTHGYYSCWDGERAMLNLDRWRFGVPDFGDDVATYRTYLVNHEVGHGLGHGHVECPAPGRLAPVMMQQTRSVEACRPNGWPHP